MGFRPGPTPERAFLYLSKQKSNQNLNARNISRKDKYSMKRQFDFSILENRLTGNPINEDFLDDFSDDISASRTVVSDDEVKGMYDRKAFVAFELNRTANIRKRIDVMADKIETLFFSSRIMNAASVVRCDILNKGKNSSEEVEVIEWQDFPKEEDYLIRFANKDGYNIHPHILITFTVTYIPVENVNFVFFSRELEKLASSVGNAMGFFFKQDFSTDKKDSVSIMFEDENGKTPIKLMPFGVSSLQEIGDVYKMLYGKDSEIRDEEFTRRNKFDAGRLIDFIKPKMKEDVKCPVSIAFKSQEWIGPKTLLIKVNVEPAGKNPLDVYNIYELIKKYIFDYMDDSLKKNNAVGVSVTSDAKITGADNKKAEFPLNLDKNGKIMQLTPAQMTNYATVSNVSLDVGKDVFKTNRFVEIEYEKNLAKCYILIPLANGYLAKNWQKLKIRHYWIENIKPFIETRLD